MFGEENLIGMRLGNYRILKELGSGGFGRVYKGEHWYRHSIVAIKVLHAKHSSQRERALFIDEALTLEKLEDEHILPLIDVGDEQGKVYMVTKYAPGGSLRDLINSRTNPRFPVEEALPILFQIGQALGYIHHLKPPVVHRDLKPENILFSEKGAVLLADFGLATPLLSTATVAVDEVGTPLYMAPEQFENKVSVMSDQYALGCIAYELLTGQYPFQVPPYKDVLKHFHQEIAPTAPSEINKQIPTSLSDAILKAMAKNRAERHEDIRTFVTILQQYLQPTSSRFPERQEQQVQLTQTQQAIPPSLPPGTFSQWYTEGNTLYENGQYVKAIKAYRQATLLKPDFADVYVNTGIAHYDLRQYEQAVSVLEQAIHHKPDHAKAHYYKGLSLSELGRYDEAAEAFRRTIRYQPDHLYVYQDLGDILSQPGHYQEAAAMYEKAVQLHPDDAETYNALGLAWRKCGNWKKALQAFERGIQINPGLAKVHFNKGNTHYECGEYSQALEAYNRAIRLQPQFASAYYGKSNVLSKLGRFHDAELAEKQAYLHGYKG